MRLVYIPVTVGRFREMAETIQRLGKLVAEYSELCCDYQAHTKQLRRELDGYYHADRFRAGREERSREYHATTRAPSPEDQGRYALFGDTLEN